MSSNATGGNLIFWFFKTLGVNIVQKCQICVENEKPEYPTWKKVSIHCKPYCYHALCGYSIMKLIELQLPVGTSSSHSEFSSQKHDKSSIPKVTHLDFCVRCRMLNSSRIRVFLYFVIFCLILAESCQHWYTMGRNHWMSMLAEFCQYLAEN